MACTAPVLYPNERQSALWKMQQLSADRKKEHPDVLVIEPEGQTIKVDQIRRLQTEFSRSGYESRKSF